MSQSLGTVEFGRVFNFGVSNRDSAGADSGWDPLVFDVLDNLDGSPILLNHPLVRETDRDLWYGSIDTAQSSTEFGESLRVGTYTVMVKPDTSEAPATFFAYNFTIGSSVSDRLKRVLGLLGENMRIDNFTFDTAGNAIGYRVRLFESKAAAETSSPGITDVPEPGEFATYTIEQDYTSGRRLRISHTSLIDDDPEEG